MAVTTTSPLRASRLRRLAASPAHAGTVSLYLGIDGHVRPRLSDCVGAFDSLAHEARVLTSGEGAEVEASVGEDLERMRSVIRSLQRRRARGLAIFACHATGLFDVVSLPVSVFDAVAIGEEVDLGQLVRAVEEAGHTIVALVDREHARLFSYASGRLTALEEDYTSLPRRHDQGGWSASSIQRHTDELGRRHLSRAAAHAGELLMADPDTRLLLGGPGEDVAVFTGELHPDLRARVAGRVTVRVTAGDDEIARAVGTVAAETAVAERGDPVAALRSAIGLGVGVGGLPATLDALSARRCAVIVTSPALRVGGWKCPACGALSAAPGTCGCGASLEGRDNICPAITAAAVLTGCRLAWVDDPAALSDLGGIGAILRF